MDQAFSEKRGEKPRILVAPLDWGLGHATRCIPLIRELLDRNCAVWLAGEGAQQQLLSAEFPHLPFLQLPGYRINYARTKRGLIWKMIKQGPKMKRAIKQEHDWLKEKIKEYRFDAVISDNRYGMYSADITSIIVTHQLMIKSPLGKWNEKILERINYNYINRFNVCWVPDMEGGNNLAGELSHPSTLPVIPLQYIGPLSRFQKKDSAVKPNHLLVLLSGPEPQRSIFEEMIIRDIAHYNYTATIVRGLPGSLSLLPSSNMIKFHNHLTADELNNAILEADYIIGRTGYSTVMDLVALEKKALLVPTPGQTEQEYLAAYLQAKGIACSMKQENFSLEEAIKLLRSFSYQHSSLNFAELLPKAIDDLLKLSFRA